MNPVKSSDHFSESLSWQLAENGVTFTKESIPPIPPLSSKIEEDRRLDRSKVTCRLPLLSLVDNLVNRHH